MIELKNICWDTPDGNKILRNLNLTIEENRIVAITGPNGSGKTSFARVLMGIEKPTAGNIFMDGKDITNLDVTERAKMGISFAFQSPVRLKGITVEKILNIAANRELDKKEICVLLQNVGLCAKDYMFREIDSTLSGGEMKRIELATVLARNSSLTILDEPEAGIDLWSFENLIDTFENMHKNMKGILIIISHQERILNIADEIVLLSNGQVVEHGSSSSMMKKILSAEQGHVKCCERRDLFDE